MGVLWWQNGVCPLKETSAVAQRIWGRGNPRVPQWTVGFVSCLWKPMAVLVYTIDGESFAVTVSQWFRLWKT